MANNMCWHSLCSSGPHDRYMDFLKNERSFYSLHLGVTMDNNWVIKLENATVRFNMASQKVDNLKEYFVKLVQKKLMFQEFIALQNINLVVNKGESWGVIGTNGSGKSTLLKLICGIITPYKGAVQTKGTIAPMIELSAGFDGNLTARENIFLNGALLGRSKSCMEEHFDKIVDFSETHAFLDVPVKNYSSGMRARLGFAIATVVQPDILVVDEVLAVGDHAFQRKCENRMQELLNGGTTLLYVSHSIESVKKMCSQAIWLNKGIMEMQGNSLEVCNKYMERLG